MKLTACTAQLIYLICVGLPDVPHGGLRPCDRSYHCEKRSSVRKQLSQTTMSASCDEGVRASHGCKYSESDTFAANIYGMFGCFRYGCYISGSGLDDALIEADVFRKRTLISILTESHYYRSKQSTLMIVKVTDTLSWEVYFLAIDTQLNDGLIQLQVPHSCRSCFIKYNTFLIVVHTKPNTASYTTTPKVLTAAQWDN